MNHQGDLNIAKQLIDLAVDSGADAVKFQAFRPENLVTSDVSKADYQQRSTDKAESQLEMLKKLELSREDYASLKAYCEERGILFLITPFDEESLVEISELGVDAFKVASTDLTNLPFLKKIAAVGKPIILSTGMAYLEEVSKALEEISELNKDVILLQCTSCYPLRNEEVNLKVINTYKEKFNILIGYSDHSVGLGAAPYSIPMGAKVIEKHFTFDKNAPGPDHRASLSPQELKDFVETIRNVEVFMGSSVKAPTAEEADTRKALAKCFVARKQIKRGERFGDENIVAKRTGGRGISPISYPELYRLTASKDYNPNEVIEEAL